MLWVVSWHMWLQVVRVGEQLRTKADADGPATPRGGGWQQHVGDSAWQLATLDAITPSGCDYVASFLALIPRRTWRSQLFHSPSLALAVVA